MATPRKINNLENVHCVRDAMAWSREDVKQQFEMVACPGFEPASLVLGDQHLP